ncbi:MAG: host attachment protein [Pseudomonadota bacterium]
MGNTWILVANASKAHLYLNDGPKKGLKKLKEFDHAASREKGSQLVSDRPGHNKSRGNGHGSYISQTEPKQAEAQHFAIELSRVLGHGRSTNEYQRLILVAPPAFMGELRNHLDPHTLHLVSDSFEKDYTKVPPKELHGHLESCIFL